MSRVATDAVALALNAGSSSLKFELFDCANTRSRQRGAVRGIGHADAVLEHMAGDIRTTCRVNVATHLDAIALVLEEILDPSRPGALDAAEIAVTAHRIVHGGTAFTEPVLITSAVTERLAALGPLAPLHNPPALAVLDAVGRRLPGVPAVAVFDTAFYRELPEHAARYAVPRVWLEDHGIRRFGFHGIAHAYLFNRLRQAHPDVPARRVVTAHLGQGCSVTALAEGLPAETSMGFTPLEGLIMGTRSGDIDAGAVLYMARRGRAWDAIEEDLNHRSGLLGLSGASDDVRELTTLADAGHEDAALALTAFCHRIRKYVGAYVAVLGGLDALVFGGGIGENSALIRARVCEGFEWIGLELDAAANARCVGTEDRISAAGSRVAVQVIPVHEEEALARAALKCIGAT
jgi:acetate kinase